MLNAELARHRFPPLEKFIQGVFDTMQESRKRWPGKPAKLDAVCERVGVSTSHRVKHGALVDAQLCAEVLLAMHREQRSFPDMFVDTGPTVALAGKGTEMSPVMVLAASAEELAAHMSYLAGMSGDAPIWHNYTAASAAAVDQDNGPDELEATESAMAPC